MRRKRLRGNGENDSPKLDISSLVDVSFLLLVFFLAVMTLQKAEADLEIELPGQAKGVVIDHLEIVVRADGVIEVNEEVLEAVVERRKLPRLRERLEGYKRLAAMSQREPLIIVKADDESEGQRLVDVMNCLAEAKIKQVTLSGFQEE
ncbi:MAG: biopolymer transporter ExbD [Verrucomicrobiota bacterium]